MNTAEIIDQATWDGLTLTVDNGKLRYAGVDAVVAEWLPVLREHKAAIVAELDRERRHAKVRAMLGDGRYAVLVENETTDPVIATCAIREVASFELAIPHHSYDGLILLELIEKQAECREVSQ